MSSPEFNDRGLPSVNERRVRRARLLQWFVVFGAFCVVVLGVLALVHGVRNTWRGKSGADANARNALAEAWPKRSFEFPPIAALAPPKPAAPMAPPAPVAVVPAATPRATVKPGDQMMLTGNDIAHTITLPSLGNGGNISSAASNLFAQRGGGSDSGPLGGMLSGTHTERAYGQLLGDRNMILAKGSTFDCVLNTKIVSTVAGLVSCTVPRNVYSDNGKVVLIERGSTVTGEYRSDLQTGRERIFVLWDRVKTANGVTIHLNSPATDALGEAGVGGYVDNHWWQRIGASVLLSLVEDAVAYKTTQEAASSNGSSVVLLPNTSQQTQTLAGKILDSTINIPPTLTRNQGERLSVFVARDLDFGSVYELRAE